MPAAMEELPVPDLEMQLTELKESTEGLGNWLTMPGELPQYYAEQDQCMTCLTDLLIALKHDSAETNYCVRLKLGEWKILSHHLIPLLTSYREDPKLLLPTLNLTEQLTARVKVGSDNAGRQLEFLQDYKEAFAKKDVFIVFVKMLHDNLDDDMEDPAIDADGGLDVKPDRAKTSDCLLSLLRNLVSIPDPQEGDPGFTPLRRNLQVTYIRHFHEEGFLDFLLLLMETTLSVDQNVKHAWAIMDIVYSICTHIDPEAMARSSRDREKTSLASLLQKERALSKLRTPSSSRHARFGTTMEARGNLLGEQMIVTAVNQETSFSKGKRLARREFRDPAARSEKKIVLFHDAYFVDLEEGSVRDHNLLNAHIRGALEASKELNAAVLVGLKKFFDELLQTSFSPLVSLCRGSCTRDLTAVPLKDAQPRLADFDRPKVLNITSWFLEFHRHIYFASAAKMKKEGQSPPDIQIAFIQETINLDMIQFVCARLREYGKESNMNPSSLVLTLRALSQQLKTIHVITGAATSSTQEIGYILFMNIIKEDVLSHYSWILKNFKPTTHDPRILTYTLEVMHITQRLMTKQSSKEGVKRELEFQVERSRGARVTRASTSADQEIAALADARVIENLFHLLEKYARLSTSLVSMLVKLLYQIIRARPENIVFFFELSYFVRIYRIVSDPVVRDIRVGKQYQEMVELLRYILRQFFKCAERNGCVFAELLFRKVQENAKEALLGSHASEFCAILDNYEDEEYKKILSRVEQGETISTLRARQKALLEGTLPWSEEENEVLHSRYPVYCDHPLCAELLAAELPEETRRTARQVRKQLEVLGIIGARGRPAPPRDVGQDRDIAMGGSASEDEGPAAKKPRVANDAFCPVGHGTSGATVLDEATLELDLERLLDAEMDKESMLGGNDPFAAKTMQDASASATLSARPTALDTATASTRATARDTCTDAQAPSASGARRPQSFGGNGSTVRPRHGLDDAEDEDAAAFWADLAEADARDTLSRECVDFLPEDLERIMDDELAFADASDLGHRRHDEGAFDSASRSALGSRSGMGIGSTAIDTATGRVGATAVDTATDVVPPSAPTIIHPAIPASAAPVASTVRVEPLNKNLGKVQPRHSLDDPDDEPAAFWEELARADALDTLSRGCVDSLQVDLEHIMDDERAFAQDLEHMWDDEPAFASTSKSAIGVSATTDTRATPIDASTLSLRNSALDTTRDAVTASAPPTIPPASAAPVTPAVAARRLEPLCKNGANVPPRHSLDDADDDGAGFWADFGEADARDMPSKQADLKRIVDDEGAFKSASKSGLGGPDPTLAQESRSLEDYLEQVMDEDSQLQSDRVVAGTGGSRLEGLDPAASQASNSLEHYLEQIIDEDSQLEHVAQGSSALDNSESLELMLERMMDE